MDYMPPVQTGDGEKPKKGAKVLIAILCVVAVLLLAGIGFLVWRLVSPPAADDPSMQENFEPSEVSSVEHVALPSSLEGSEDTEEPAEDIDGILAQAEAYLREGQFALAANLLSSVTLEASDPRYGGYQRLLALATLDPAVVSVDTADFPNVTVVLSPGEALTLTLDEFLLTEGDVAQEITGFVQEGGTVRLSYRSGAQSAQSSRIGLSLVIDGITYHSDAEFTAPSLVSASLKLVSTDVTEYPLVKVYFRITDDASGESVAGLDASSFVIKERVEGGEYLAREVKSATVLEGNVGMNIDLVADKSSSISDYDMGKIKNVMIEFVNNLHYEIGDKAEVLAFDSIVQQMCYYTGDVNLLINGINNMSTDGSTAFYDAVYDGVTNAALQGGARCVIAFTDGEDNRSYYTPSDVIAFANTKQVPVYIIGVGSAVEEYTLRSIAEDTGGRYWYIDDLYDLSEIYSEIYAAQGDMYMVEYESDSALDTYLARELSVEVNGGGAQAQGNVSFTPVQSIYDGGGETHDVRYELVQECLTWEEASRRCQEMGGHLATITSQAEMDQLVAMAEGAGLDYIWLGGYTSYDENGNVFGHWVTGEAFTYQAWSAGEPSRVDKDGTEEWYIMLWNIPSLGGWTWNDQRNDPAAAVSTMIPKMGFICEYES